MNNYLCVNGAKIQKLKAKNSEINAAPLCLANVPKDFSVDNMKKHRLFGYFYDFSVDYGSIDDDDNTLDIHF